MIEQIETPHDDVFAYAVTGRITEDEFTAIAAELEAALEETETLHLVARMPEWPRFDLDVLDDDIGLPQAPGALRPGGGGDRLDAHPVGRADRGRSLRLRHPGLRRRCGGGRDRVGRR